MKCGYCDGNFQAESLSKTERSDAIQSKFDKIQGKDCLNMMVTAYFLEVEWVYERVFREILLPDFAQIINSCKISLNNLNEVIMYHISTLVSEEQLSKL